MADSEQRPAPDGVAPAPERTTFGFVVALMVAFALFIALLAMARLPVGW